MMYACKEGYYPKGVAINIIALSSRTTEASVIRHRHGAADARQRHNINNRVQLAISRHNERETLSHGRSSFFSPANLESPCAQKQRSRRNTFLAATIIQWNVLISTKLERNFSSRVEFLPPGRRRSWPFMSNMLKSIDCGGEF